MLWKIIMDKFIKVQVKIDQTEAFEDKALSRLLAFEANNFIKLSASASSTFPEKQDVKCSVLKLHELNSGNKFILKAKPFA